MLNIILERLNKKNGQVFTQDDIKKIDDNAINIENTLNNLSTVASSGSYNDLTNKPTIPIVKLQSFLISSLKWEEVSDNTYTLTIKHNLNSKNIICQVYNSLGEQETLGIKKVDLNNLLLTNTNPLDGEITIIVA